MVPDYTRWELEKSLEWPLGAPTSVAISPDGRTLAVGGGTFTRSDEVQSRGFVEDGLVQLWNIDTESVKLSIKEHGNYTANVAFFPDGAALVIGSRSVTKVVDAETGALRYELPETSATKIGMNQQRRLLSVKGGYFWDLLSGQPRSIVPEAGGDSNIMFSPDGVFYVVGHEIFDVASRAKIGAISLDDGTTVAAFSHDSKFIALRLSLWEVNPLRRVWSKARERDWEYSTGVEFSPDDKFILSTTQDGDLLVRQTSSGEIVHTEKPHSHVEGFAISSDGRRVVTIPAWYKGEPIGPIKVWKIGLRPDNG
jgi:WD40 repeat protein